VAVGDVSGHNVAAGVLMSMLKIAFRTELAYLNEPEQLIASLNKTVYDHTSKNMFISFIFGLINPAEKKMTLVNCGHPPLLHYSWEKKSIQSYRTGDVALGLREGVSFGSKTIKYSAGDIFVFYSDGLTETANVTGVELNLEAIARFVEKHSELDAESLYNALTDEVNDFRGQAPQRDDVTVVVIKMK
jgi:sigma-B regulation protein RsbU (phosphoserine phosphatase)